MSQSSVQNHTKDDTTSCKIGAKSDTHRFGKEPLVEIKIKSDGTAVYKDFVTGEEEIYQSDEIEEAFDRARDASFNYDLNNSYISL